MITDDEVERACTYLSESSRKAAKARANRLHLDDFTKHLEATLKKEHMELAGNAQEREARADDRYRLHLEAVGIAVEEDCYNTYMREAASARIEVWRTQCSNERAKL